MDEQNINKENADMDNTDIDSVQEPKKHPDLSENDVSVEKEADYSISLESGQTPEELNRFNVEQETIEENDDTDSNTETETAEDKNQTVVLSEQEQETQSQSNRNRVIPFLAIAAIIAVAIFLLFLLPLTKTKSAREMIDSRRYEEAVTELSGILPLFHVNELKEEALQGVIQDVIEKLQIDHPRFSKDVFEVESITDNVVDIQDGNEKIDFDVKLVNKNCSVVVRCHAEKTYRDSEWTLDKCDIVSTNYLVNKECDQNIPDEAVMELYPNAVFVEKGEKQQLSQNFIYEYKDIDKDNPFLYANYKLNVLCTYNVAKNEWVVLDMGSTITSTEEIPFKEFTTSIFTIRLPEAWYMWVYEYSYSYDYNGEHREIYNYSYHWFVNKEESFLYSEKNGGPALFSIYMSADNASNSYTYNHSGEKAVNTNTLGRGWAYEDSVIHYCDIRFEPVIRGLNSSFSISSNYADVNDILNIINGIKLKNTSYSIEVLVKQLNIRKGTSTYSEIIGSTSKGQKYTATEACDDYEGYRWYKIADNQWIADLDGKYLKVIYK